MGDPLQTQRKRHLRWWLVAIAGALAMTTLGFMLANLVLMTPLHKVAAEADRLDPGWQWDDLQGKRSPVADGENSLPLLLNVHDKLGHLQTWSQSLSALGKKAPSHEQGFGWVVLPDTPANAPLPPAYATALKADLEATSQLRTAARELAKYPRGRVPARPVRDVPDESARLSLAITNVHALLAYDAHLLIEEGDSLEAARSLRAGLRSASSLTDEPYPVLSGACDVMQRAHVRTLERLLAHAQLDEQTLRELQEVAADAVAKRDLYLTGLRGERALHYALGKEVDVQQLGPLSVVSDSMTLNQRAAVITLLTQLIEASKKSREAQAEAFQVLRNEFDQLKGPIAYTYPLGVKRILLGQWDRERQARAALGCALVAIAAERYRLKYGNWPHVTRDLTPLLHELPTDPYDGLPIQVKQVEDGLIVYSVGVDGADNGGNIQPTQAKKGTADLGLKLWNPLGRSLPPGQKKEEKEQD